MPSPPLGDLPNPGIKPRSLALQVDSLPSEPPGKPMNTGVVAYPFSRGSSRSRKQIRISCIAGEFFTAELPGKPHEWHSVQFISVTQLCPTLCDPTECSMPVFLVHHQLLDLAQTHVHQVSDAIPTISSSVIPFSSCLQSFPASASFPMSLLFASGGQSTRVSASVFPMNIQD